MDKEIADMHILVCGDEDYHPYFIFHAEINERHFFKIAGILLLFIQNIL